ncbi:hypothetical protein BGW36DRAFT_304115, partial [Talaromyces proteolyticus]
SRRNYVRKTFTWDQETQYLVAAPKMEDGQKRIVVTEDMIADIVEHVHENNGPCWMGLHRGISKSYYGIFRSGIIYLLRQWQICAYNQSKRPKNSHPVPAGFQSVNDEFIDFLHHDDSLFGSST